MPLDLKTQDQIVQDGIAAVQAQVGNQFKFTVGSIVRALIESNGRTALWLESLAQYVLARTRLATSTGSDADSFVADFGLTRLPGVAASGLVNFTSFSTNQTRYIEVATSTVSIPGGAVTYQVYADLTNEHYVPDLNAYQMTIGTATISVPVIALTPGIIGNAIAGEITVINSPITGVDQVTNPAPFENGVEPQSDPQLRKYFVDYLNSLSRATRLAIEFAIETVQQGLFYTVIENIDYTTQATRLGYFYAIVDDGSGSISGDLLQNIINSVELYRGLTIAFEVKTPQVVLADIAGTINLPAGYSSTTLVNNIVAALDVYITSVPMGGGTLFYNRVIQIIYNAILSTINNDAVFLDKFSITGLTIDGVAADLTSTAKQAIRPGSFAIVTNP